MTKACPDTIVELLLFVSARRAISIPLILQAHEPIFHLLRSDGAAPDMVIKIIDFTWKRSTSCREHTAKSETTMFTTTSATEACETNV